MSSLTLTLVCLALLLQCCSMKYQIAKLRKAMTTLEGRQDALFTLSVEKFQAVGELIGSLDERDQTFHHAIRYIAQHLGMLPPDEEQPEGKLLLFPSPLQEDQSEPEKP